MNSRHKQVYYKIFKKYQREHRAFRRYGHINVETIKHYMLRTNLSNHAKDYILKVTVLNG